MKSNRIYKCIVVEDEKLIRNNIIKKINALNLPISIVGEAISGVNAMVLVEKTMPDLVISDIKMPGSDGIELAAFLHKNYPFIKMIIISGYNDFSYAQEAIHYNVKDYLLKPLSIDELHKALQNFLIQVNKEQDEKDTFILKGSDIDKKSICELLESYLKEHYKEDISFHSLGEQFGFTPEYLGKIFKKHSGDTLSKYVTKLRMNEAKHLLINNPEIEVQKVGEIVGFKDAFYFSRAFKNHTGVYPSEYRLNV